MKEEVFRLEQVSLPPYLSDIHLHLYCGEVVGLIGLNALGIEELLAIFQKNIPLHYGHVYCQDKLVNDYLFHHHKENNVTMIERSSLLIETLSVEENLFILRKGCKQHFIRYSMLSNQMETLLKPFNLPIKKRTLVKDLSQFEKLVIQFIKAKLSRSVLVILKDISSFVSESDLLRLKPIIKQLCREGMTFLYVCNHHQEAFRFCNRCYLMREGRIIKHLLPDQMNDEIINQYVYAFTELVELGDRQVQYERQNKIDARLSCNAVGYNNIENLSFSVGKGETVVLLDGENLILDDLFSLLCGTATPDTGSLLIDGERPSLQNRNIALVPSKPDVHLVFNQLSLLDNLLFTADHKLKRLWLRGKHRRALGREMEDSFGSDLDGRDPYMAQRDARLSLVYQRLVLQNPSFLCVVQPFASVDMYQRIQLISFFDLFKKKGASVLILAVTLSDTLQIADRLLVMKDGTVERELLRSEFAQYRGITGSIPTQPKK